MSNGLKYQIQTYGAQLTGSQAPITDDDVRALGAVGLASSSGEATRPVRRVVIVAFAFAVVLIVIGGTAIVLGGPRGDAQNPVTGVPTADATTSTPPSTTTESTPPSTATEPPTRTAAYDSWQRVGADVMQPVVGLFDMTQAGSRLIAVGFDPGEEDFRQNGVIFVSDDGVTWTRLAEDDPALTLGAVLMYGIAEGGPGLVAVGTGCEDNTAPCATHPTVWTSVDGTSWTRSAPDPDIFGEGGGMMDVAATDYGIVAAGSIAVLGTDDGFFFRPAVWLSPDGADWSRVWEGDLGDAGASSFIPGFTALAADSDGLIVGVGSAKNEDSQVVAAVWISTDGRAWERIEPNSSAFGSENGLDVTMLEVTWGSDGFIAVGTEGGTHVAIWKSVDGHSWIRIDTTNQPFGMTGTLSAVAALDTGFVTTGPHGFAGGDGTLVTLWTSPDGSTWDRVQTLGPGYTMAIVVTDAGIFVAGATPDATNFHAAVWAGPAFDPDAPPPDPMSSSPPTTIEETSTDLPGIGTLDEGASCEELASTGYSYAETVAYWARYESPVALDPDGNGLPCEDEYPAPDVAAVYGTEGALSIHMAVGLFDGHIFLATGPAVDAGIICPAGTVNFVGKAVFYSCDDGTGTFIVRYDVFIDLAADVREYGIWTIASGTGNYQSLTGGGGFDTSVTLPDTWADSLTGRLATGTGNN